MKLFRRRRDAQATIRMMVASTSQNAATLVAIAKQFEQMAAGTAYCAQQLHPIVAAHEVRDKLVLQAKALLKARDVFIAGAASLEDIARKA